MAALATDAKCTLVETLDDVLDMRAWLGERREYLGCDVETSGLNLSKDRIRLFQLGDTRHGWGLDWSLYKGVAAELLPAYRGSPVVFHNSPFDLAMLRRDGVRVPEHLVEDTLIGAHLIAPEKWIGLKPVAARIVGPEAVMGRDDLHEAFVRYGWDWDTVPIDFPAYWVYSCLDTMLTAGIAEVLIPQAKQEYGTIYEIEMAAIHVLVEARLKGVTVDMDYVTSKRSQLMAENEGLAQRIPFAPSKDAQAIEYLERVGERGPLGGWWPFRTEKGRVSIDDDALAFFEDQFPDVIPPLRRWRKNSKVVGTYLNNIERNQVDSVIRCNVHPVGATKTSRMSITEPALQTLPRGRVVRDAFVAREGHRILLADYSQAEARVFASLAGCQPMIDSFKRGEDQHRWVAGLCYHDGNTELVQPLQRQVAKNVGYANIYMAGVPKIAATAGVSIPIIEDFLHRYNGLFPEVERFKQAVLREMSVRKRETGQMYVTTRLGRRLVVDSEKPYTAVNYVTQSSATSDVLKLKICEVDAAGVGEYLRLPIHDEMFFEVPDAEVGSVRATIERVMPETQLYECPLAIETDVVDRWGEHYEQDPARRLNWEDHA